MKQDDSPSLPEAYNQWHANLGVDQDAITPWHQMVRQHLPVVSDKAVLEIGCGRGGFARWLASQEPALLVAADFSATAVSKASEFGKNTGARFAVADICRLPHADRVFDVIVSCETIEHVPGPRSAVTELARVLKAGGQLFMTTPNYVSTMGLYRAYRRMAGRPYTEEGQPVNNLTLIWRTMAWLRAAGLHPRLVDARGHYVVLPRQPRPIPIPLLDGPRSILQWFARHQLIVASKS